MRKFVLLIMAVLTASSWSLAQNRQISGVVTDNDGQPISGATVLIEGTSVGTTTNINGEFSLSAPADGTLSVSFIGYETMQEAIAGKTWISFSLKEDTHAIDDVIVVAYGTAKKESFTGSVAVVKSEELEHRKVANVTKAIDGLAPGVQATSGSGQPGSGSTIVTRGFGSINAPSTPLYVETESPMTAPSRPSTPTTSPASASSRTLRLRCSTVPAAPTASCSSPPRRATRTKRSST